MQLFSRTIHKEITFVFLLVLGGWAIARAQDATAPKKVKVLIEVTEDGKTSTSTQEVELDASSMDAQLHDMMEEIEMVLEEAMRDMDQSDVEIIINKRIPPSDVAFSPLYRHHFQRPPHSNWMERSHQDHERRIEARESRPFLGVVTSAYSSESVSGVRLDEVVEGSAAESSGLLEGDVIISIDEQVVSSHDALASLVGSHQVGDELSILFRRGEEQKSTQVTLGERQEPEWLSRRFRIEEPNAPSFGHGMSRAQKDRWDEDIQRKVFLGIEGRSLEDEKGVELSKIFPESTAEEMGLQEGDVLRTLNDEAVEDIKDLVERLNDLEPGEVVKLEYERDGKLKKVKGALKPYPHTNPMREKLDRRKGLESRHVFRFEIEEVDGETIRELNKKSGASLDESNALETDRIMISPNPGDGLFVIDALLPSQGDVEIQVLDINGKTVLTKSVNVGEDGLLTRIDLSDQTSGVYFVSLFQEGKGKVMRIVKR
jgi:C-terminal processing protease CtpA/Prc